MMSRKRLCLKILSIAVIAAGMLMLISSAVFGVLYRVSGDGTIHLMGGQFAAVEIGQPDYPRGSLVRLRDGSIPENVPVAVRSGGVMVISYEQLAGADEKSFSREQILGGVELCLPLMGWLLIGVQTTSGMVFCMAVSGAVACGGGALLAGTKRRKSDDQQNARQDELPASDPFPELDYKLGKGNVQTAPSAVKTVVITQTRAASSAIRSQKGEVRIFASGQEKVLPLNVGKRVVTLGGYTITVDIARTPERTEDITRELPVIRS